jgi:hypothetical protein
MMKVSQLEKAIAALDVEIEILQHARQRLVAQRHTDPQPVHRATRRRKAGGPNGKETVAEKGRPVPVEGPRDPA